MFFITRLNNTHDVERNYMQVTYQSWDQTKLTPFGAQRKSL